jgi:hypothetical protein
VEERVRPSKRRQSCRGFPKFARHFAEFSEDSTIMHAAELLDLASILALHGPSLLYRRELIPPVALQEYWTASRSRFDAWHEWIANHREATAAEPLASLFGSGVPQSGIVEEVLLSEPLTRVYAALGAALDEQRHDEEISPVTHSVYLSHLETRSRVLRLMLDSRRLTLDQAVQLNKLRATAERWCDALLGQLGSEHLEAAHRYGFDPPRVTAFAEDVRQLPAGAARETAAWLTSVAMRDSLLRRSHGRPVFPAANRLVADAVLLSLRPDLFDSVGRCKSLWLHRLEKGAEQADRVLDSLAQADISGASILWGYEAVRGAPFGRW